MRLPGDVYKSLYAIEVVWYGIVVILNSSRGDDVKKGKEQILINIELLCVINTTSTLLLYFSEVRILLMDNIQKILISRVIVESIFEAFISTSSHC